MIGYPSYSYMQSTYINKAHWDDLYTHIHDAYVECIKNHNSTYEQKLARILGHMIENKKHFIIREFKSQSPNRPTDP